MQNFETEADRYKFAKDFHEEEMTEQTTKKYLKKFGKKLKRKLEEGYQTMAIDMKKHEFESLFCEPRFGGESEGFEPPTKATTCDDWYDKYDVNDVQWRLEFVAKELKERDRVNWLILLLLLARKLEE